jgi:hypothetical protein
MDDQVRATALLRKAVMFRVELMAIKSKAEFHGESIGKSGGFGYSIKALLSLPSGFVGERPFDNTAVQKPLFWTAVFAMFNKHCESH